VLLVAGSLLFAGCDFVNKVLGTEDDSDSGPKEGAEESPWKGVPVPTAGSLSSIKAKFGIQLDGAEGVTAAFQELSAFIKKGGLGVNYNVIRLGDYIDLEGGLTVAPYGVKFTVVGGTGNSLTDENRGKISLQYNANDNLQLLRLVVVGINSFRSGGTYNKTENNGVAHVVFQFQNIPGVHIMNPGVTVSNGYNTGGYAASEMREYLVPVEAVTDSGNFLTGLVNAGVPAGVLWGPTRYMATVGKGNVAQDVTTINDLLWLPTQFEMTGASEEDGTGMFAENGTNQVRLEYYTAGTEAAAKRVKSGLSSLTDYWLSSASTSSFNTGFVGVYPEGTFADDSYIIYGVVPAFCVR
jgi:hypothetical protein